MTRTAELIQAFAWICDECGEENFVRAITLSEEQIDSCDIPPASSPEEAERIDDFLKEGGEGKFLIAPSQVQCKECRTRYFTSEA